MLKPYQGAFSKEEAAHLLRRTCWGAPLKEVEEAVKNGLNGTVDDLLNFSLKPAPHNPFDYRDAIKPGRGFQLTQLNWLFEMLHGSEPFRENLALMWHNHFVVATDKVKSGAVLTDYLNTLRKHALGSFTDLALAVSKHPSMLRYLDNDQNVKGRPNENFSRELLELFTVGIGNYTEKDIQEGARALTGWTIKKVGKGTGEEGAEFVYAKNKHDAGVKTYLGKTGNFSGEEVVQMAAEHPAAATFVSRKILRHFVSDVPSEADVKALADTWTRTNGNLRTVIREVLLSEAFFSEHARNSRIKSPVEYIVGTLRTAQMKPNENDKFYEQLGKTLARLGQLPLTPPDVSGWAGGRDWISDATLLTRMRFAAQISKTIKNKKDLTLLLLGRNNPGIENLIRDLPADRQAYLLMVSPEYQLA
ncbi:DUF1800 domain-containing protein [Deinococcus cellulosilyticus]|uniref:DUF1800 domain-containing protein n=1 Tax=Deinococcus cellulosilyticus (strain DSM 18568 / NBRC 106333 / KACC 11606 / 5516J-15) TaxID=1223518 RepID=A0A511N5A9_DEIC1|nr:DUF1800 domain-containing protein [Deinococcus cellulosilyticus]GEM48030.1 hypothetical protein DC3_36650 [Deinococcus cellulosilyticus NBRC 106333 = KACC 11606]